MYIFLYLHILFAWFAYFKDVYTRRYVYVYIYIYIYLSMVHVGWDQGDHDLTPITSKTNDAMGSL